MYLWNMDSYSCYMPGEKNKTKFSQLIYEGEKKN